MTLDQFLTLERDLQAKTVWQGAFISDRREEEYWVLLYQVHGFYVEVFYKQQENLIEKMMAFSAIDHLEPYLSDIDISSLF